MSVFFRHVRQVSIIDYASAAAVVRTVAAALSFISVASRLVAVSVSL